jgi:hypothetical protein
MGSAYLDMVIGYRNGGECVRRLIDARIVAGVGDQDKMRTLEW